MAAKKKSAKTAKKVSGVRARMTKTQVYAELSEKTELSRKQISAVFEELSTLIQRHIKKGAIGEFTLPGLLKIKTKKKPARKAQKNVPNPFRPGEVMDVKAKPASIVVKALPLKALKEMAQ